MKHKYLCLRQNGDSEWVTISDQSCDFNKDVHDIIHCDCFEVASTFIQNVVLILDESGKCKPNWWHRINFAASDLYPGSLHGDPIVGDVIVAYRVGPDLFPVPMDTMRAVNAAFHLFWEANYDDSAQ